MKKHRAIELRVVTYEEDKRWFAHCLELDIVADGISPEEAMDSLMELTRLQVEDAIEHNTIESLFRAAPPEIWDYYAQGQAMELISSQKSMPDINTKSPLAQTKSRFEVTGFNQRRLIAV